MKTAEIVIHEGVLADAILISRQIPEFINSYTKVDFENRLRGINHLVLVAYLKDESVGFKVGYEMPLKRNFYSWMGGVLPKYRQIGIADKLGQYQENWARNNAYESILIKTRRKHKSMIQFLHKNNFKKIAVIPFNPDEETRLLFEKKL